MECTGLFISAPLMTMTFLDVLLAHRESLFLRASPATLTSVFYFFSHKYGEQSVVQVEKPSPAMAQYVSRW